MNDQDDNVKYDQTWLHRYQQGKLTSEELEQYEIYLLDHPEHVQEVELEETITETLNFLGTADKYREIQDRKRDVKQKLIYSNLATAAACLLLALLLGFWMAKDEAFSGAKLVYLESYRSIASEQVATQVELGFEHERLILVLPSVSIEPEATAIIELFNLDTGVGLGEKQLAVNSDGEFVLVLHSEQLTAGQYELIQKAQTGEKLSGRRLNIVKK